MTKDVLLCIQGLQFEEDARNDEELDKIETICTGEYYIRNGAHYILYEEVIDGFDEPVKNIIKIRGKEFSITKRGGYQVQMVFAEGKKTMTDYVTPFGNILIGLDTSKIEMIEEENSLQIHIDYALEANYQYIADCHIMIKADSKDNNEKGKQIREF